MLVLTIARQPISIILNDGNLTALQPVGSVATGLLSSPYNWTPVASKVIRPGVQYVLSIVQSGLTNYSPVFSIESGLSLAERVFGAPLPVGAAGHYRIQRPMEKDNATNTLFSRHDATGVILPRYHATGPVLPRDDRAGVITPRHATSAKIHPRNYATGVVHPVPEATPAFFLQTGAAAYATGYSTGTGTGSSLPYATGARYNNSTAIGTVRQAAADKAYTTSLMPITGDNLSGAHSMDADLRTMIVVVTAGCALLLLWS
ncbi:MAG: hypothetical protein Q9172_005890 [Xanthocarpia lactea]